MILWVILFLLIIAISFALAYKSMRDYQEIPQKKEENYGLYLVRKNPVAWEFLDSVRAELSSSGGVLSLERLFKGRKTALCIFGPKNILEDFIGELRLLELEDYIAGLSFENMDIWEVGVKSSDEFEENMDIFASLPKLYKEEQFFWQVIIGAKDVQIRAAIFSESFERRKMFIAWFEDLAPQTFYKVPRPYSKEQMFDFFYLRSLGKDTKATAFSSAKLLLLVLLRSHQSSG